ncbi:hypothetical protein HDE_00333 [Halotydeus destructor]|nr:hypothetical protein HDE_00333 [Halotydeus destructor]
MRSLSRYQTYGLNCSEIVIDKYEMGIRDSEGNYSGFLGMIQRQEVDFAPAQSRLDCLGDSSLRVLAVSGSAEVRIFSKKVIHVNKTAGHFEPMLETLSLVDHWSFFSLLASVLAVAMVISLANSLTAAKKKAQPELRVNYYFQTLWSSFELLVNQGKSSYVSAVPRLLWLSLTLGLFVIVSGIFLNTLSTEQVAQREPDQIDTMDDLLHKFRWQKPTIMSHLFTNSLRYLTKNGSQEHELFEMIKSDKDNTYNTSVSYNIAEEKNQITFEKYFDEGGRYMLLENAFWFPTEVCSFVPQIYKEAHISKKAILDGILVTLFNNNSDPRLIRFMSYRLENKLEFGIERMDMLKLVQDGEIDYAFAESRLDCIGTKSLRVLGLSGSAEVQILSKKVIDSNQSQEHFEPMLDAIALVDEMSFLCLAASVLAVAMVISLANTRRAVNKEGQVINFLGFYLHTVWASFELLVSQGKFNYISAVQKLTWLILTVGLFIVISGVFLNLISTEQVAQRDPDQIDTFGDLLHKFSWQEPTLMANFFTNSLRDLTQNGSEEDQLFQKIKSNENNTYTLETSSDSSQQMIQFTVGKYLEEGNRYLLLENIIWFPDLYCYVVPDLFDTIHMSKETILDGILVVLHNSHSDPRLVRYMSYRFGNKLEFGFHRAQAFKMLQKLVKVVGYWELGKENSTRCRFRDHLSTAVSDMQFKLVNAKSVLHLLYAAVFAAIGTNFLEMICKKFEKVTKYNVS